jgi:hypothetical protein
MSNSVRTLARCLVAACVSFVAVMLTVLTTLASAGIGRGPAGDELSWHGGPVVHASAPYLVYWTPGSESIPASSRSLLERYLTDATADSGKSSDGYAVLRQYYDSAGFAAARQTFKPAHQVVVDHQPYPPRNTTACPSVAAAYPTCISDGQLQSELERLIIADRLPTAGPASASELPASTPIYLIVTPGDVNVCFLAGTHCFATTNCAYHAYFVDKHGDNVLYAVIPMEIHAAFHGVVWPKVCQYDSNRTVQEPNGDAADVVVSMLSHELSETITDPINQISGWFSSSTGNEVGDLCGAYGPFIPPIADNPLAFTPTLGGSAAAGTLYTELINGHRYYTQSEWSNGNRNCAMRPSAGRIVPQFTLPRAPQTAGAALAFNPAASTSRNPLSSATWSFGDGSSTRFLVGTATLSRVNHRYRQAGRYTITLTLVDNRGNLKTTTHTVDIK